MKENKTDNSSPQKLIVFVIMGAFVFSALFVACSATKATTTNSTESSSSSNSTGKTVHNAYCLTCHGSKVGHSSYSTSAQWDAVITSMQNDRGANFSSMTTAQREALVSYLVENSSN